MSVRDEELQRYFDGEVSARERVRIDAALAADPRARARLEALSEMRDLLREAIDEVAEQAPLAGLFAAVRRDLAKDTGPPPLAERLRMWWEGVSRPSLALAAAAGVTLAIAGFVALSGGPTDAPTGARIEAKAPRPEPEPVEIAARPMREIEIESLEVGGESGTVVPMAAGVIWIVEANEPGTQENK